MQHLKEEMQRKRQQLEEENSMGPAKKHFKLEDMKKLSASTVTANSSQVLQPTLPAVASQSLAKLQEVQSKGEEAVVGDILVSNKEDEDHHSYEGASKPKAGDVNLVPNAMSYTEILELGQNLGEGNVELDIKVISQLLMLLLQMWDQELNSKSEAEEQSTKAKGKYAETQRWLKPLFVKLRNKSLNGDILNSVTIIVGHLLKGDYCKADEAYFQMSIGKAPWLIGATRVSIHDRTGREKISTKNVGHIMNDETQRKYIQGLKRLMMKCKEYFENTDDPSHSVNKTAGDS